MDYNTNIFKDLDCAPELIPDNTSFDLFNHMQDSIYTKDLNSRYCFINKQQLVTVGFQTIKQISGKLDEDLCWQEYGDLYKAHDQDTIKGLTYRQLTLAKSERGESLVCLSFKQPIYDANKNILGVIGVSQTYQHFNIQSLYSRIRMPEKTPLRIILPESIQQILTENNLPSLTTRQMEVLFYLLQGKSPKTISRIINISLRTVTHHINFIKEKWNCYSSESLVTKAWESDLFNCLPSTLFHANLLKSLDMDE
ncbi:MAG: helix-turn-helix transcriptional regulator [Tatlockia sp.]|jgi:DNA-binding CsgD family transcriptional regulator